MAAHRIVKVIAALPPTLEPNAIYLVRVGEGFDILVADSTGTTAHAFNGAVAPPEDGDYGDVVISGGVWTVKPASIEAQMALRVSSPLIWKASVNVATPTAIGGAAPTAVGTATGATPANTNLFTRKPRCEYLVTAAATNAVAGFRGVVNTVSVGGATADVGGFDYVCEWGPATGVATMTNRAFVGLRADATAPTDTEPSANVNCIGMGWDATDTNVQMMHNDATGTCTKINLGASFPVPSADRTQLYRIEMSSPKGPAQSVAYRVTNINTGAVASGTITTDLPITAQLLGAQGRISTGGTSSVIGLALNSMWLDPLY